VQLVREPVKRPVLVRIVEVEDVLGDDADLADARSRGLELGERREALLRPGRPPRRGQGRQAKRKAILEQVILN
jgi:hypothetical protein